MDRLSKKICISNISLVPPPLTFFLEKRKKNNTCLMFYPPIVVIVILFVMPFMHPSRSILPMMFT
jgi:hypothetical protein